MRSRNRDLLLAAALLPLLGACGGYRTVRVPMLRPAEINLSAYPSLGVTSLGGDTGNEIASLIEEKLVEGGHFQVVDRTHMTQVMDELRLSASDLAQGNNAVKLGGLVTAGALISGSVDARYRELPRSRTWKDSKGASQTEHWKEGEAYLRANLKLIDVTSGRLLLARSFEAKEETRASLAPSGGGFALKLLGALAEAAGPIDHRPPDRSMLERDARTRVVEAFVNAVAPRKEEVEVRFAVDAKIPQLESGIGWAQRGEWKKAQDSFAEALHAAENDPRIDSKVLAKAYLDAGLAHALGGDHAGGLKLLGKAYDLSADPYVLEQIDFAKRLADESRRLSEQLASPAAR